MTVTITDLRTKASETKSGDFRLATSFETTNPRGAEGATTHVLFTPVLAFDQGVAVALYEGWMAFEDGRLTTHAPDNAENYDVARSLFDAMNCGGPKQPACDRWSTPFLIMVRGSKIPESCKPVSPWK
jgi:hypothetical protein